MFLSRKVFYSAVIFSLVASVQSFGLMGIGFEYGYDRTLQMSNTTDEKATFDNLKLTMASVTGSNPGSLNSTISGSDIPITISRTDWARSMVNFGGKVYVDIIPFIDCIEISSHFSLWEYDGKITYPTSMAFKANQPTDPNAKFIDRVDVTYATQSLTLKDLGAGEFLGLTKTPYAKLHCDASIRKYILKFPPVVNILKLYAGGGFDIDFATPMLSSNLITDALGSKLDKTYDINNLQPDLFGNQEVMKAVATEVLNKMFTPHYGMHLMLGTMIKIPVIPLALYVDGKYIIPFGKMDEHVDIGGMGFVVNGGILLAF